MRKKNTYTIVQNFIGKYGEQKLFEVLRLFNEPNYTLQDIAIFLQCSKMQVIRYRQAMCVVSFIPHEDLIDVLKVRTENDYQRIEKRNKLFRDRENSLDKLRLIQVNHG